MPPCSLNQSNPLTQKMLQLTRKHGVFSLNERFLQRFFTSEATTFENLGVRNDLATKLKRMGIENPTEIQQQVRSHGPKPKSALLTFFLFF